METTTTAMVVPPQRQAWAASSLHGKKWNLEFLNNPGALRWNIELPMEKINWLHTITVVNYHLSTLYVLKLLLEGRIGRANVAICTFSMRLPFLENAAGNSKACFLTKGLFLVYLGIFGTTLGAHRCYKAKRPLRYFLVICHCLAAQVSI